MRLPAAPAAGAAAVSLLTLAAAKLLTRRWDGRLGSLQNVIFAAMGEPEQPMWSMDASDPELPASLAAARLSMDKSMGQLPSADVASVQDLRLPASSAPDGVVPVRVYYPPAVEAPGAGLPWVLYTHGGGFVQGSIDSHDGFCRRLCAESGTAVASVGYRLAPEAPWPAAVDDAFDALLALAGGNDQTRMPLDPRRCALAGDSAGGTIAAQLAARARDAGIVVRLQLLLCPALDALADTASYAENESGPMLTASGMRWFWRRYLPAAGGGGGEAEAEAAEEASAVLASPLRAPDAALAGVAPAYIVTAECDVLRDEGEAYAARLRALGVPATCRRYDGAVHAFVVYAGTPFARGDVALAEAVAALKGALA